MSEFSKGSPNLPEDEHNQHTDQQRTGKAHDA
jgi:hypothetical protein